MLEDKLKDIDITTSGYDSSSGCKTIEYKEIDVTVPITIEPYACLGDACVEIIDDPCIIPVPKCMRKHNCQYAIKQKLCVIFPIEFNAVATSGPPICSLGDDCNNCNKCDCEEFVRDEIKARVKDKLNDKIKDEIHTRKLKDEFIKYHNENPTNYQGVINNTESRKVAKTKKSEDELEALYSYKKLGNYIQILI